MRFINNINHIIGGSGKQIKELYFSIDLIPIRVTLRYDLEETFYNDPFDNKERSIKHHPEWVNKIHSIEYFQVILDEVCIKLGAEERQLFTMSELPKINIVKDDYFYEYLYSGHFGRNYYIKSKMRHLLKYHESKKIIYNTLEDADKSEHEHELLRHFKLIKIFLNKQNLIKKHKEYYEFSNDSINKFTKRLTKLNK